MKYFSLAKDSVQELHLLRSKLQNILKNELKLETSKNFFLFQQEYYPINIGFFKEDFFKEITLGEFVPQKLKININWDYYFQFTCTEQSNLLRHELAHYIDFILRGDLLQAHDSHYKKLCASFGWGEEVSAAKQNVNIKNIQDDLKEKLRKRDTYNKILSLSKNNPSWEEAQAALLMAKRFLTKHGMSEFVQSENIHSINDDDYVLFELEHGKRMGQKIQTLAMLLENFHCKTIFKSRPGMFVLEIICKKQQLESIVEIYHFFNQQIDQWFHEAKKLHAKIHRKSFYNGLREGLENKFKLDKSLNYPHLSTLIKSDSEKLNNAFSLLYPRHGTIRTLSKFDTNSFAQGKLMGHRAELKNKISTGIRLLE